MQNRKKENIFLSLFHIKTSGIDPRYEICYFSDNIFILYLILAPQMITPGLDLSNDARGTENCNSVPVGTEFKQEYAPVWGRA